MEGYLPRKEPKKSKKSLFFILFCVQLPALSEAFYLVPFGEKADELQTPLGKTQFHNFQYQE